MKHKVSLSGLMAMLVCACVPMLASSIGSNSPGYFIIPSPAPFQDITATGTQILAGTDDATVSVNLGFTFQLFDPSEQFNSMWISSDGVLGFGAPNDSPANVDLNDNMSGAVIAPAWSDWQFIFPGTGAVYYQLEGQPGAQQMVVEWSNAGDEDFIGSGLFSFGTGNNDVSFEAILYQGTNDVLFSYQNMDTGDPNADGASATVGIEGTQPGQYVEWSYDQPDVPSYSSLLVDPIVESDDSTLPAPEPASLLMLGAGFLGLAAARRRRTRKIIF